MSIIAAKRALAPILLLAASAGLASCGSDGGGSEDASRSAARPVLVLRESQVPQWTAVSAEVSTVDQAQALARIPGILTSLSVKEGDYVRQGQSIGRIVDSQLGYQSSAYGAQAAAAQAQAAQAQAELSRAKYLYDNGVYAKARLEQAQAAASAAQAQIRAARAQQQAVQAVAGHGVVLAPATGRVLVADVPAGSVVAPGTAIAAITSGPVVLRLQLPESLGGKVRPGSAVRVVTGDGRQLAGTVGKVYPSVSGGQVRADADVTGIDETLIGRRLAAEVETGTEQALLVPRNYVVTRFGIDYVEVRSKDGAVGTVPVQIAPSSEDGQVAILSGVSAGDALVKPAEGGPAK